MGWAVEIKNNPEKKLKEVYIEHKENCTSWLRSKYNIEHENSIDIFQQSVLVLYDNAVRDKIKSDDKASMKTYLFSVAKNLALQKINKNKKWSKVSEPESILGLIENSDSELEIGNEEKEQIIKLNTALVQIGDPCRTLLKLFYYQKLSFEEISQLMSYKNIHAAKSQKYKCMQRIRKIILN